MLLERNIINLAAYKNYGAIWYHKGSLLEVLENILVNEQPKKPKMSRQVRFRESELLHIFICIDHFKQTIKFAP